MRRTTRSRAESSRGWRREICFYWIGKPTWRTPASTGPLGSRWENFSKKSHDPYCCHCQSVCFPSLKKHPGRCTGTVTSTYNGRITRCPLSTWAARCGRGGRRGWCASTISAANRLLCTPVTNRESLPPIRHTFTTTPPAEDHEALDKRMTSAWTDLQVSRKPQQPQLAHTGENDFSRRRHLCAERESSATGRSPVRWSVWFGLHVLSVFVSPRNVTILINGIISRWRMHAAHAVRDFRFEGLYSLASAKTPFEKELRVADERYVFREKLRVAI